MKRIRGAMNWTGQSSALGVPIPTLDQPVEAALIVAVAHSIPFPTKNEDVKNGLCMEIKALPSLLVRWLDGIWSGRGFPVSCPFTSPHHLQSPAASQVNYSVFHK